MKKAGLVLRLATVLVLGLILAGCAASLTSPLENSEDRVGEERIFNPAEILLPQASNTQWFFTKPFAFQHKQSSCTPIASSAYKAAVSGISGVWAVDLSANTGNLGYTIFTWGGYKGFYNPFVSESKNKPNQICKVEAGLGVKFTPPFTGKVKIVASFLLNGKGVGQAGAGGLDLIANFLPWSIPFLSPSNTLFPTVATAKNQVFLKINGLSTQNNLRNLAVASLILFPKHMEVSYERERVTISFTASVQKGKTITILAGMTSELKSWGNASVVMNLIGSSLDYIVVIKE